MQDHTKHPMAVSTVGCCADPTPEWIGGKGVEATTDGYRLRYVLYCTSCDADLCELWVTMPVRPCGSKT